MGRPEQASSERAPSGPHVLREYALLADGYHGALVGPEGAIGWLCGSRWDSPAVLSSLVGGPSMYAVAPVAPFVWGGYYEPRSLIWRSRWVSNTAVVECREALARPASAHQLLLLRRIEVLSGDADLEVVLDLGADFGAQPMIIEGRDDSGWFLRTGGLICRWTGAPAAERDDHGRLRARLRLREGDVHDLVLRIGDRQITKRPDAERSDAERSDAERPWQSTQQA